MARAEGVSDLGSPSFQSLLEAMDGVAHVVNRDQVIIACGERNWRHFARENGGKSIADPAQIIGRPIMTFVEGEEVAGAYSGYLGRMFSGDLPRVSFRFRCDAPDMRRDLWMSISPIGRDGHVSGALFQSVTLNEQSRPPIGLFDFEYARANLAKASLLPIVSICSYCQSVSMRGRSDEDREWTTPEAYYRAGGPSQARLSHGICPACFEQHVSPYLDRPPAG
ncbi:MAG: hypothetical protein FJX54_03300 [Alphaproteobacteria bacterium]|nr:hypothetical protein [Alphaproteobacteria bacterium]